MKMILRTTFTTALWLSYGATTLAVLPTSASFADDQAAPTRVVAFADLDLSKPAGVQTLYRRIQAAARTVCEISVGSEKYLLGAEQSCIERAVNEAVKNVQSTALVDMNAGRPVRLASK